VADAIDSMRRWQEVVKISVAEKNTAPPGKKPDWEAVRVTAQACADHFAVGVALEKAACKAWQDARMLESDPAKPKPVFRLVP